MTGPVCSHKLPACGSVEQTTSWQLVATAMHLVLAFAYAYGGAGSARANEPAKASPAAIEFFERDIRPLFVEKCQSCHGNKKSSRGLSLTSGGAVLKGGERGPAVVPGKPAESLFPFS